MELPTLWWLRRPGIHDGGWNKSSWWEGIIKWVVTDFGDKDKNASTVCFALLCNNVLAEVQTCQLSKCMQRIIWDAWEPKTTVGSYCCTTDRQEGTAGFVVLCRNKCREDRQWALPGNECGKRLYQLGRECGAPLPEDKLNQLEWEISEVGMDATEFDVMKEDEDTIEDWVNKDGDTVVA